MSSHRLLSALLMIVPFCLVGGCVQNLADLSSGDINAICALVDCNLDFATLCEQTGDPFWCDLVGVPQPSGQPAPDTDGDQIPDTTDNCPLEPNSNQADCDGDQTGDACDTEPDCNENGTPDNCDIQAGSSDDCQPNGVPDECDIIQAADGSSGELASSAGNGAIIQVLWWDSTPEYVGQAPDSLRKEMSDYLTNFDGGSVFNSTYVSSEVPGTLAGHLAANSYDVIVFDSTSNSQKFNGADLEEVRNHYAGHPNVLLDGILYIRSINFNASTDFPGINGSTGGFTANEVYQLGTRGGGIMVGTDHDCCQVDANQIVGAVIPGAGFSGNTNPSVDGQFNGTDLLNAVSVVSPFDIFNHWSAVPTEAIAPTGSFTDVFGQSVTLFSQVDVADAPGGGPKFPYISTNWEAGGDGPAFDCNHNGVLDSVDIALGTSQDCDLNFIPDECDPDCDGNSQPDGCEIVNNPLLDRNGNKILDICEPGLGSRDCNGNATPDECELEGNDCNEDSIPDDCQLVENDCNDDGIPDECQLVENDCNEDFVPDECQLYENDCNGNKSPDECDIQAGSSNDCQPNGVPDECDIDAGTSQDCQPNGYPDECDIASGTSTDDGGNGVPDECQGNDCNLNGTDDDVEQSEDLYAPGGDQNGWINSHGVPVAQDLHLSRPAPGTMRSMQIVYVDHTETSAGTGMMTARFYENNETNTQLPAPAGLIAEYVFDTWLRSRGNVQTYVLEIAPQVTIPPDIWVEVETAFPGGVQLRTGPATVGWSSGVPFVTLSRAVGEPGEYFDVTLSGIQCDTDCNGNQVGDSTELDSDGDETIDECESCPHEDQLLEPSEPDGEQTCDDGIDNDCDGDTDDADAECAIACPNTCGDLNGDQSVDLVDFASFIQCLDQPGGIPECVCSDMNGDEIVNLNDFTIFIALTGGSSTSSPPDCP